MFRHTLSILFSLLILGCTAPPDPKEVDLEVRVTTFDVEECCAMTGKRKSQCPRLRAYWETTPNVNVCDSVDLSIRQVSSALDAWRDLGYQFGEVKIARWALQECNMASFGEILIRLPSREEISAGVAADHLAATKTYTHNPTGSIQGADIWFVDQSGVRSKWVLEHEIGHALGWMHCDQHGHIMNSMSGRLGPTATGASYSEYLIGRDIIREVLRAEP